MPSRQPNHAAGLTTGVGAFEAFRQLVYLTGVEKLAPLMGMRPGTLYNKADASDDSHNQPTLRDVVMLTQITNDMRVLDALNETFGRAAFDCRQYLAASDEALLELVTKLGAETGEFHRAFGDALKQKRFTAETHERIRSEAFDMVAALMTLVRRLEGYVDE